MKRTIPALAAVAVLTLAGCADDGPPAGTAGATGENVQFAEDTTTVATGVRTAPTVSGPPALPLTEPTVDPPRQLTTPPATAALADFELDTPEPAETGYLAELGVLDAGLAENGQRALDRASNVCQELGAGKELATVITNTAKRFDGAVPVDDEMGRQIVAIIERNLCPAGSGS
ncbi:MAG: hypothetical protein R2755_19965 [Acidimicrobiales bacterium]